MNRYERQTGLKEIGTEGQKKISETSVLIIGVGGLGSPTSLYLTGAGIGHIGLMDGDNVSLNNLHRQVLYTEQQIGKNKAECAAENLQQHNSEVRFTPYPFFLDENNAEDIISKYDIVIDGCDNFRSRYLISDTCDRLKKPYVYGAIGEFNGQVSVFCYEYHGKYLTYRDLLPDEEAILNMPAPSKAVLGTMPSIVGCTMATETIKLICGFGDLQCGKLWTYDALTCRTFSIEL